MDVAEVRLSKVLGGESQYRVPLYQRAYSWGADQFERLWRDLVELTQDRKQDKDATHFTGSLVLSLGAVGPAGDEFLVVDGQQRLTTLSVLLCALRDHVGSDLSDPDRAVKRRALHEKFIVDPFSSGDRRLKLLPTQADRDAYRAVVDTASLVEGSNISKAYRFFAGKLREVDDPDDPQDIEQLQAALLAGLTFVSITARGDENVFRIFESLNNTGMQLTQGDLVRNFVFMQLGSRADAVYDDVWREMQRGLTSDDLADLFWIDLIPTTPTARRTAVYALQQSRMKQFSPEQMEAEVKRFARLAALLKAARHPDPTTPLGGRLLRLREWSTASVEPLVVHVLQVMDRGNASESEALNALATIESFLVRRLIGGAPESAQTRLLLNAVNEVNDSSEPIDVAIRRSFSTGRRYFFTDDQIRSAVRTRPFYFRGRPGQKKLVLSWIEQAAGHKEPADLTGATIEHVMPQSLTEPWRAMLATDLPDAVSPEQVHEELLHTLGNLTLSAYNPELSNRPFSEKREQYRDSNIQMTRDIAQCDSWTRTEVLRRADALADQITSIWVGPLEGLADPDQQHWSLVDQAVTAIPKGRWTSYGEIAALAGSHPVPVGAHIASAPLDGAWRVLQATGTVSPGFKWRPGSEFEGRDPLAVLEEEGLEITGGQAAPGARISAPELADLLGLELDIPDLVEVTGDRETAFLQQLSAAQPAPVVQVALDLMDAWRAVDGVFRWGQGRRETSCTFAQVGTNANAPIVIYPRGTIEVNFQFLKNYVPFNDLTVRREFRRLLTRISGVRIDDALLWQRPVLVLENFVASERRTGLADALRWFAATVAASELSGVRAAETESQPAPPPN